MKIHASGGIGCPGVLAQMIRAKGIEYFDIYIVEEGLLFKPVPPDRIWAHTEDEPERQLPDWLSPGA